MFFIVLNLTFIGDILCNSLYNILIEIGAGQYAMKNSNRKPFYQQFHFVCMRECIHIHVLVVEGLIFLHLRDSNKLLTLQPFYGVKLDLIAYTGVVIHITFISDIVFFIFLYQRWIYKTDPTRVNEFGFSGEMEQEAVAARSVRQANGTASVIAATPAKDPVHKKKD